MLSKEDVKKAFMQIGVNKGDILVLQSSYKGTGGIEGGAEGLIKALIDLVGPKGSLIMPAYNFHSWTENHYFDIYETPSEVGTIPELFRLRNDVGRTRHPIHSLSIWGDKRDELCKIDHQISFGSDSVFAHLLELNAIYSTIGLGVKMPFLPCHYSETIMKVSYRRRKDFAGIYVDERRTPRLAIYSFDVRKKGNQNPVYQAHEYICQNGEVKTFNYQGVEIYSATAKDYHKSFIRFITEFPEMFT